MKTKLNILIPLTALLLSACTITAQMPPANSVELRQRNTTGDDWLYRLVSPAPNSLLTFGDDSTPAIATLGAGLTLASGTLSSVTGFPITGNGVLFNNPVANTISMQVGGNILLSAEYGLLRLKNANSTAYFEVRNGSSPADLNAGLYGIILDSPGINPVTAFSMNRDRTKIINPANPNYYIEAATTGNTIVSNYIIMASVSPVYIRNVNQTDYQRIKAAAPTESDDLTTKAYVDGKAGIFPITGDGASLTNNGAGLLNLTADTQVYIGSASNIVQSAGLSAKMGVSSNKVEVTANGVTVDSAQLNAFNNIIQLQSGTGPKLTLNNNDYAVILDSPRPFLLRDASSNAFFSELDANALAFTGRNYLYFLSNNPMRVLNTSMQLQRLQIAAPTGNDDAATKAYVDGKASGGGGVPSGGTTNQVLAKLSNDDGDASWIDKLPIDIGSVHIGMAARTPGLDSTPSDRILEITSYRSAAISGKVMIEASVDGDFVGGVSVNGYGSSLYTRDYAQSRGINVGTHGDRTIKIGTSEPVRFQNNWNYSEEFDLQRIKIADPTEDDDAVTLGYADSNYVKLQPAVTLTNPTQEDINALGKVLLGNLEIILTDPTNPMLYINGFSGAQASTGVGSIWIRIRSTRNNGLYLYGNQAGIAIYSEANGPVTIPFIAHSGGNISFINTSAYPNSDITVTGNTGLSGFSTSMADDRWHFASIQHGYGTLQIGVCGPNFSITAVRTYGHLHIGSGFLGTIGTITSDVTNYGGFVVDARPAHTLDTFARAGGGGGGGGSSLWTQSDNNIYYNSGNVGIGNEEPAYKLDVNGDINLTGDIYKNGEVWNPAGGGIPIIGDGVSITNEQSGQLTLSGADGGAITFTPDGNLMINPVGSTTILSTAFNADINIESTRNLTLNGGGGGEGVTTLGGNNIVLYSTGNVSIDAANENKRLNLGDDGITMSSEDGQIQILARGSMLTVNTDDTLVLYGEYASLTGNNSFSITGAGVSITNPYPDQLEIYADTSISLNSQNEDVRIKGYGVTITNREGASDPIRIGNASEEGNNININGSTYDTIKVQVGNPDGGNGAGIRIIGNGSNDSPDGGFRIQINRGNGQGWVDL